MKKTKYVNPTMFFFVNKALKLSQGKLAAQIAHAKEELTYEIFKHGGDELKEDYLECCQQNPRTVIVLEVENTEELYKANSYLESCGIWTGIYVDEKGKDYLLEPTVMCTEYVDKEDPRVKLIFGMFKLYTPEEDCLEELKKTYWDCMFRGTFSGPRRFMDEFDRFYREKTGKGMLE